MQTINNRMTETQIADLFSLAVQLQVKAEESDDRDTAILAYSIQNACSNLTESQREFRAADATIHNLELQLTDMAVQLANAESKCRELAAENAGLKSGGAGFFAYSEETGFETHKTKAEAITSAEDMIGVCREEASSDGWPEDADSICWGIILQKAVEVQFEKPAEENGWIGWSEYSLSPSTETPATDVYLAEVRAQGVDMLTANRKSEWMDSYIDDANEFAAQLRKGAAL
ncbi:hypothetical protein RZO68_01105 [Citrobacter freundii]|nr:MULTISPECIES: hypothetical protein [Citrobacter]MDM3153271.1 hypothetical protein [Citrobacter sp. Cf122]MDT7286006.1 hypothetical protein [Citrobacter freundii]MDV0481658.1 hypothetical protein [Citrobacter freundii]MDV0488383.1 hypothetical protein [Citrobacter freundii]MDV0491658.1 hypothetical protein [Citrobacter freundii]